MSSNTTNLLLLHTTTNASDGQIEYLFYSLCFMNYSVPPSGSLPALRSQGVPSVHQLHEAHGQDPRG
jgi:hypothetical protein